MKFQKIFFILLFVLNSLVASEKSYNIVSTDIIAVINQNGTIDFSETREFNFKGDFTFVYQDIPKRGFDQLLEILEPIEAEIVALSLNDQQEALTQPEQPSQPLLSCVVHSTEARNLNEW